MLTSSESAGATSWSSPRTDEECDFCGETVHPATAVSRVERRGDELELITLCAECAADDE